MHVRLLSGDVKFSVTHCISARDKNQQQIQYLLGPVLPLSSGMAGQLDQAVDCGWDDFGEFGFWRDPGKNPWQPSKPPQDGRRVAENSQRLPVPAGDPPRWRRVARRSLARTGPTSRSPFTGQFGGLDKPGPGFPGAARLGPAGSPARASAGVRRSLPCKLVHFQALRGPASSAGPVRWHEFRQDRTCHRSACQGRPGPSRGPPPVAPAG